MTIVEAERIAAQGRSHAWLVLSPEGVCGVVSPPELRRFLSENEGELALGSVLNCAVFPHVHRDHTFDFALERMGASGLDLLPVVSRFNVRELLGIVRLSDILAAYRLGAPVAEGGAEREQF